MSPVTFICGFAFIWSLAIAFAGLTFLERPRLGMGALLVFTILAAAMPLWQ